MSRSALRTLALALLVAAGPARAQLPVTITPELFPFPGAHESPASAASAGLALADRWLGIEPFANPAGWRHATLTLSPMLLHVSRQDLRAQNRNYEETSVWFDGAGASFTMGAGALGIALYGYQPVVRLEDNAFERGRLISSGTVTSNSSAREFRGGAALSLGSERRRLGFAAEWTERADHYERIEQTGGPSSGTYTVDFTGGAPGGQAGFRLTFGPDSGTVILGGAMRYIPELSLAGDETIAVATGTTTTAVEATRTAAWEGGLSLRVALTEALAALAAGGGSTEQEYKGWGVTRGAGAEWKVGFEYHDRRDPWTVRIGFGQEQQSGVPEPRAFAFGIGIGFLLDTTRLEGGLVHRSFSRNDLPASADDRVVVSLVQRF